MELLEKCLPDVMLILVVSSMLAVGLGLAVAQIIAPVRSDRLVALSLVANFVVMPAVALGMARLLRLDKR